jgi:hypothetical protein
MAIELRKFERYHDRRVVERGMAEKRTAEDKCSACRHLGGSCDGPLCDGCERCAWNCLCWDDEE